VPAGRIGFSRSGDQKQNLVKFQGAVSRLCITLRTCA
jgi:hypothetical protein